MSGAHSSGELARLYGAWPGMQPVLELGRLCLQLGRVTRATYHEDGKRPETDTDHTVMLGVVACSVAQVIAPHLDLGLVSQFAQVHDFVEVHAGDTVTLGGHAAADKAAREAAALDRIRADFRSLPWLPQMITRYESPADPEARFVKVLDKVMPCINGHAARKATWLYATGVKTLPSLKWGKSDAGLKFDDGCHSKEERRRRQKLGTLSGPYRGNLPRSLWRAATPIPFRDLLLSIARSVRP